MPLTTDWSISSTPTGALLREIRRQTASASARGSSTSGPSLALTFATPLSSSVSQMIGPVRSSTFLGQSSRIRT